MTHVLFFLQSIGQPCYPIFINMCVEKEDREGRSPGFSERQLLFLLKNNLRRLNFGFPFKFENICIEEAHQRYRYFFSFSRTLTNESGVLQPQGINTTSVSGNFFQTKFAEMLGANKQRSGEISSSATQTELFLPALFLGSPNMTL